MVADLTVSADMIPNDTVSSFEKGRVGTGSAKPSPAVKIAEASSGDGSGPAAAPRGRGRAMRRSSVSSKPPEFLPLRLDREIRSKSLGRVLRKDRASSTGEAAPGTADAPIAEEAKESASPVNGATATDNLVGAPSDDKSGADPRATVTAGSDSFTSPVKSSHRTIGGPFRSPSKSPAKSPNWAHVSLKSDDYLPLRSPLNRALDQHESDSHHLLNESSSETTLETSPPVSPSKCAFETLHQEGREEATTNEDPQPLEGQQRPLTVRGMSFDSGDPELVCVDHDRDSRNVDGHRSEDSISPTPVKRPTTVRGHSFDTVPDESENQGGEVKKITTGDKTAKSPRRKARKGKASKKGKTSAMKSETAALPVVELSPNADDGAVSPSKVRPLKVRTLPVEAELLGLSELELDESPTPEAPNQIESVAVAREDSKAVGKGHDTHKAGSGVKEPPKHEVVDASTVKSRFGRKPRPQEPSSQTDGDEDDSKCEVRIELVKEEDEEIKGIKEAPRLVSKSIRPCLVRGMSMSDDAPVDSPTEAAKPVRPRGGRKARPSSSVSSKPADEPGTPQPAVDERNDGVLKPVLKPDVSTSGTNEKEPEWAKPKLKATSKLDPNEKEKQVAWTKPAWSINRSRDLQHSKISDDDTTDVSESVTEPQD